MSIFQVIKELLSSGTTCLLLTVLLVVQSRVNSNDLSASEFKGISVDNSSPSWESSKFGSIIESKGFQYVLGRWHTMRRPRPDTATADLQREASRFLHSRECHGLWTSSYGIRVDIVWHLHSPSFRSDYVLTCIDYGSTGCYYVMLCRDAAGSKWTMLDDDSEVPKWLDKRPPKVESYIARDQVYRQLQNDDLRNLVVDAITIASPFRPVVFLDDALDAWEFSNAVSGDWIWAQIGDDDSLQTLLSSPRLIGVGSNSYFKGNYLKPSFPVSSFEQYDSIVKPLTLKSREDGGWEGVVYTWSPEEAVLARWFVKMSPSLGLQLRHEVITRGLGFTFTSL